MPVVTSEKKDFPCPVCGSEKFIVVFSDTLGDRLPVFTYDFTINFNKTYRIVRCISCSHHYASPRHGNIWQHYDGDIADNIYLEQSAQRILTAGKVLPTILRYKKGGRLLDIGCATGDFLSVAKDFFRAEGLEISSWSSQIAREKGLTVHRSLLKDYFQPGSFDVITMWGVIEHLEYPNEDVKYIHRLLNDDGIVCLWTGDISSRIAKLLGKKWWYMQGQHIQMFTRNSITLLFSKNGFDQLTIDRYPYALTGTSLLNSLSRYAFLSGIAQTILNNEFFSNKNLTLPLPGEMLAIFKKKSIHTDQPILFSRL